MLRKFFLVFTVILATSFSVAAQDLKQTTLSIHEDILKLASTPLQGKVRKFEKKFQQLNRRIIRIHMIASGEKYLESEISNFKKTLADSRMLFIIRKELTKKLNSHPTTEELMKTFFELKAIAAA